MEKVVDLSRYKNALTRKHQMIRMLWSVVWAIFVRPLPRSIGSGWERFFIAVVRCEISFDGNCIFFC